MLSVDILYIACRYSRWQLLIYFIKRLKQTVLDVSYWISENRLYLVISLPVNEQEFRFCATNHAILAAISK